MRQASDHNPTRRPRFKRRNPPPLELMPDDLEIIRHVAEHRFLRSTHIVQLLGRPRDKILRRLHMLFHNGYLDRPLGQRDDHARGGNAPLVYALGSKGAVAHGAADVDWPDMNRSVKRPYIEHALLVADFMVSLECALRAHPNIRLLRADDIIATVQAETGHVCRPWTMTVLAPDGVSEMAVTPDKVFALEYVDSGRRNYFLIEADRATMPITRPTLDQSSFKKKLLAYHRGHAAGRHRELWGIPGFRVLTITRSTARIDSMLAALKEMTAGKGSNVFLFAVGAEAYSPVTLSWRSAKGVGVQIIDPGRHSRSMS